MMETATTRTTPKERTRTAVPFSHHEQRKQQQQQQQDQSVLQQSSGQSRGRPREDDEDSDESNTNNDHDSSNDNSGGDGGSGAPGSNSNNNPHCWSGITSMVEFARYVPVRLDERERSLLNVLENTLAVLEYTDHVDVSSSRYGMVSGYGSSSTSGGGVRRQRMVRGLSEACDIAVGLAHASLKTHAPASPDHADHADFLRDLFEVGRRNKVLNPAKMRSTYGKLMYMLQDACQNPYVQREALGFDPHKDMLLVGRLLAKFKGGVEMLHDVRLYDAVMYIDGFTTSSSNKRLARKLSRDEIEVLIQKKKQATDELIRDYSGPSVSTHDDAMEEQSSHPHVSTTPMNGHTTTNASSPHPSEEQSEQSEEQHQDADDDDDDDADEKIKQRTPRTRLEHQRHSLPYPTPSDLRRCIDSLSDAVAVVSSNVRPIVRMLHFLEEKFHPTDPYPPAANAAAAAGGVGGVGGDAFGMVNGGSHGMVGNHTTSSGGGSAGTLMGVHHPHHHSSRGRPKDKKKKSNATESSAGYSKYTNLQLSPSSSSSSSSSSSNWRFGPSSSSSRSYYSFSSSSSYGNSSNSSEGPTLSHSHATQYTFVYQSLSLWTEIQRHMHRLWVSADHDLLRPDSSYRLCNTGQGLHRVQPCPSVAEVMRYLLVKTKRATAKMASGGGGGGGGGWVGLSVVHLGDRDVPNALMFIDKYTQVPWILKAIVDVVEGLEELCGVASIAIPSNTTSSNTTTTTTTTTNTATNTATTNTATNDVGRYIVKEFGSVDNLRMMILSDYFKYGFDGSGDDGGSCIDGRLTSTWNWTSRLVKKSYYHAFMMSGFQGFDGEFK